MRRRGAIYEYDEVTEEFQLKGSHQIEKEFVKALRASPIRLGGGQWGKRRPAGRQWKSPTFSTSGNILPYVCAPARTLGYRSILAVPLLREEQIIGGLTSFAENDGELPAGSCKSLTNFRDPIGPRDPKRPAVPGNRGEEPPDRGRQPAQVGIPRQHVPRAAHAAQCHHRLL